MNVLDLFSGIGGFSLGLERAGMRTVAFCEIDPYCQAVLRKHWPNVPIFGDITKFSAERGLAHVICGGFPCQDISVAGKGAGIEGERSGLWSEYARIIGEVRPRYVIVENVAALLGRGLSGVLGDLAALGYDAEWHCIPASAVGAPHRRDRVWIVGYTHWEAQGRGRVSGYGKDSGAVEIWPSGQSIGTSEDVAYRAGKGQCLASGISAQLTGIEGVRPHPKNDTAIGNGIRWNNSVGQWRTEPDMGRVAHGVPLRVDRLRALGNSIVPQIAEIIGKAIMDLEARA